MSNFLQKYDTDKTLEENGQWIPLDETISVKVARLTSAKSTAARARLEAPYKNFRSIPDNIQEEILTKQLAEVILVDWKGVSLEDGVELPATYDNKLMVLKKFPDFRREIAMISMSADFYKKQEREEVTKN